MGDTETQSQAASLKAQADNYRNSKDFQAAAESYRAALDLMPRFWQAHANLSVVLSKLGDHENSVFHAQKAVEVMPEMAELFDNLGVVYREAGRYSQAIDAHEQAIEKKPELISAYFNLGLGHLKNGALGEALKAFERAIAINPDVPQVYLSAGNLLLQQNQAAEAEDYFRSALKLAPSRPAVLHNLGRCLQDQGKLDAAVAAYQQVVRLNPESAGSYFNLGVAQQDKGLLDDAIESYSRAIALDSNLGDAHFNLGVAYRDRQRLDDAMVYLEKALALDPNSFKANVVLGNVLREKGEMEKAVAAFRQALAIDPQSKEARNNLGLALLNAHEPIDEAVSAFKRALEIDPDYREARFNLGQALEKEGRLDAAFSAYERVLDIDPKNIEALYQLGVISNEQGDKDKALAYCRRALSIDPEHSWTHLLIAKTKKHKEHDPEIAAMEKLYRREGNSSEQRKNFAFGLAKAYEDLGEHETAFEYMREGNRLKRATFEYSIEQDRDLFNATKQVFNKDVLNTNFATGVLDKTPIFVLGMPRSGTSLTEQILASHPQVHGGGELFYMDSISRRLVKRGSESSVMPLSDEIVFSQIGSEYIRRIRELNTSVPRITDKMPHNFLNIGYIRKSLPNAKIVHCRRDPMDNCLSIYKNDFKEGLSFAYDMEELGHYYLLYEDLMRHWHEAMPGVIYDIQYEKLVADQEHQTRKLLEFCELPWDDACLEFHKTARRVATASLVQVRQPIYRDSVRLWKRYASQLEPLRRIIESVDRG